MLEGVAIASLALIAVLVGNTLTPGKPGRHR